jgi:hypothetical protein
MADIYLRVDGDPGFSPGQLEITDEVQILLNQIEMLIFTRQGDVLGAETLGVNIEDLIFSLTVSAGIVETAIYNQIRNYCKLANKYVVDVNVRFFKGTERDIGVVDILVDGARRTGLVLA